MYRERISIMRMFALSPVMLDAAQCTFLVTLSRGPNSSSSLSGEHVDAWTTLTWNYKENINNLANAHRLENRWHHTIRENRILRGTFTVIWTILTITENAFAQ